MAAADAVTQTINANIAECLKSAHQFGNTRVYNVCSGAVSDVPWGGIDWLLLVGVGGFVAAVVLMFGSMAISIIRDMM